jgi:Protein of unknown function (DUF3179)
MDVRWRGVLGRPRHKEQGACMAASRAGAHLGVPMRKLFYTSLGLLAVFEIANVYFIMPMPFSQRMRTIDLAYFIYSSRWLIRAALGAMILVGAGSTLRQTGWGRRIGIASVMVAGAIVYATNFAMAADRIFLAPASVSMHPLHKNSVEPGRLVVGIEVNGDARAYPLQFIGYHHQVRDTVGGRPVLVSYCTVCRTGRVFDPSVAGSVETFRLVGMDHFNAMFEDRRTGSWWRQATGEAIAGPLKGNVLAEIPSQQTTLAQWLALHPNSLIMQPDSALRDKYTKSFDYESGASRKSLTGTDTVSWRDKAWVVGLAINGESKAYDWNRLRRELVIHDSVGGKPVLLVLAPDRTSFFAYVRPTPDARFALRGDSLASAIGTYALSGRGSSGSLAPLSASRFSRSSPSSKPP